MKHLISIKMIFQALAAVVCIIAFNNCGEGFVTDHYSSSGFPSGFSSVSFSRAPGESCEDALLNVYKSTYLPFLSKTCSNCHVPGGDGSGPFAVNDPVASYNSFVAKGVELINAQAVGSHKLPYTGPQNQAYINEINGYWSAAQTAYANCASEESNAPVDSFVVKTTGKAVAANLATTFVRMEWDLETESNGKVPLIAGIEIRRAVFNNVPQGYEFRNPTLRLKNASAGAYAVRALNLSMNEQMRTEITTYSNIDATVSATTNVNLAPDSGYALAAMTMSVTDTVILEFQSLKPAPGGPSPGGTSTPSPTPQPSATPTPLGSITYASLASNGGIFANSCFSCHSSGNARGGLDLTDYTAAKNAAQNIKSRINNPNNPMPTGGLLPQNQRDRINAWVDQGAPP